MYRVTVRARVAHELTPEQREHLAANLAGLGYAATHSMETPRGALDIAGRTIHAYLTFGASTLETAAARGIEDLFTILSGVGIGGYALLAVSAEVA